MEKGKKAQSRDETSEAIYVALADEGIPRDVADFLAMLDQRVRKLEAIANSEALPEDA